MGNFQNEKQLIREYYAALDRASIEDIPTVMERFVAAPYLWRGFHPFHEQTELAQIAGQFWQPLRRALAHCQRRMDVFMAGDNQIDGRPGVWVASMGHLMGLFDQEWLGIPPTGKMAFLRYCEFHRVEGGKITETAMYFDIPHLMIQAGLTPFPSQTGAQLVQPGPMTHDALLFDTQDPAEGQRTLDAINFMVNDLKNWQEDIPIEEELRRSWHEDMIWWGPTGIGATYTIPRYVQQHSGPFRAGFKDRIFNGHIAKIAEGHFGGFFGWPNLRLTPSGGFMGFPGSEKQGEMRVIDIYRREGDKLAENWIFIDLLHFWNQQGVDILARTTGKQPQ